MAWWKFQSVAPKRFISEGIEAESLPPVMNHGRCICGDLRRIGGVIV
jgi:hypothetical protein